MIGGQRVLAVVPARGGSKGVPRKNVRPVAGRPLIAWTFDAARGSRYLDRTILSSDDDEIMATARELGCDVPFKRPAELARDDTPGIAPVLHAVSVVTGFDIVVLLQPTSPLRESGDIDRCLEQLLASGAPACVSVTEAECHPFLAFELTGDRSVLRSFITDRDVSNMRRQDFPSAWRLNGAVYTARVSWLVESGTFVTAQTAGYRMPARQSLDIDSADDLAVAEHALLHQDS